MIPFAANCVSFLFDFIRYLPDTGFAVHFFEFKLMLMTPNPRQNRLLEEVRTHGSATIEALAAQLEVTLQTVRRDVQRLSEAGLVARFHGGVRLAQSTTENGSGKSFELEQRPPSGSISPRVC